MSVPLLSDIQDLRNWLGFKPQGALFFRCPYLYHLVIESNVSLHNLRKCYRLSNIFSRADRLWPFAKIKTNTTESRFLKHEWGKQETIKGNVADKMGILNFQSYVFRRKMADHGRPN